MEEIVETKDKRYSDAELAAEYWYAESLVGVAFENTYPWHSEYSDRWPEYLRAMEIADTFKRFAELPHAFDN